MLRFTFMMILNIAIFSLFGSEKVLIKQLNSQDSAFSQIVDGKIYLNPNRLIERDGVTYLETDALEYLPISGLFEDDNGQFVYQLSQVRNEKEEIVGYVGGCSQKTVDPKYHLANGPETSQTIIVHKYTRLSNNRSLLTKGRDNENHNNNSNSNNNNNNDNNRDHLTVSSQTHTDENGTRNDTKFDYTHKDDNGSRTKVEADWDIGRDNNGNYSGGGGFSVSIDL